MTTSASRPPGSDRPSGAPNYFLRRMGVLAVLVVLGYAVVRLLGSFVGGDDSTASGPDPADSTEPVDAAIIDCGDDDSSLCDQLGLDPVATITRPAEQPEGDVETPTSPAPEEPENTGPPSAANPAKVYIVGDSDAGTFGPYLQTLLDGTLIAATELNYKVSSGLARPDFFNWPEELATKLPEVSPDIVVVTFGGNDSQGLSKPQKNLEWVVNDPLSNQEEWSAEYERRAGDVMDLLLEDDRRVIWVGIPNDDNPEVTARLELQDLAAKAAAADRPDVVFIDTWKRFSGRDGGWAEFVIDPRDGVGKDVRAEDGFHLNVNGAEILAIDIAVAVQDELRDLGASL